MAHTHISAEPSHLGTDIAIWRRRQWDAGSHHMPLKRQLTVNRSLHIPSYPEHRLALQGVSLSFIKENSWDLILPVGNNSPTAVSGIMWRVHITHWGRVTHIGVSKLSITYSDNGLSPDRRQSIIWANVEILLSNTRLSFKVLYILNICHYVYTISAFPLKRNTLSHLAKYSETLLEL